jgi:hypothetical protein
MAPGTLQRRKGLGPEGIAIPGEEETLIRQAQHLGIPRARERHGRPANRGGAGGKPKPGCPE